MNISIFKKLLIFIILSLILILEFEYNSFNIVNNDFFHNHQKDSEALVIGRLIQSKSHGIKSNYGFLGRLEIDNSELETYNSFFNYTKDLKFENSIYTSQFGLQGYIFGMLQELSPFSNKINFKLFQLFNCIALTIILLIFIYWANKQFGKLASYFLFIAILYSPWLVVFARNLYWVPWTWFLPFIIVLFTLHIEDLKGKFHSITLFILIYSSILLKCLCGYEYISTILLAMITPYIYYFIKNKWKLILFIERLLIAGIASIFGFLTAIFIHYYQLLLYTNSSTKALEILKFTILKRTYGNPNNMPESFVESLLSSPLYVVEKYLFGNIGINFLNINFICIIFIFLLLTIFYFLNGNLLFNNNKKHIAIIVTTWVSLFAPLSWLVLAKGHSYVHTHMNYVLWYLPFIYFGIIMCTAVIKNFKNKNHYYLFIIILIGVIFPKICIPKSYISNETIVDIISKSQLLYSSNISRVYINNNNLYYFINKSENLENKIFLHFYPKDKDVLNENEKNDGFINMDFEGKHSVIEQSNFSNYKNYYFIKVELPNYEIEQIKTGQFNELGRLWEN